MSEARNVFQFVLKVSHVIKINQNSSKRTCNTYKVFRGKVNITILGRD